MGIRLIKISVIYLIISTVLAMYMSITENMTLSTVHSHISCLGWAMLALFGLIYHLFPELEKRVLSKLFFWLFNIGLPIMIIGVSFYLYDQSVLVKVVISIGAIPTSIGIVLFAINVLIGMKNGKVTNSA
jgi:cbb3-type cytochrome oxidase subunit 1